MEWCPQEAAEEAVGRYSEALAEAYQARMAAKLGLRAYHKGTAVRRTLPSVSQHGGWFHSVGESCVERMITWGEDAQNLGPVHSWPRIG